MEDLSCLWMAPTKRLVPWMEWKREERRKFVFAFWKSSSLHLHRGCSSPCFQCRLFSPSAKSLKLSTVDPLAFWNRFTWDCSVNTRPLSFDWRYIQRYFNSQMFSLQTICFAHKSIPQNFASICKLHPVTNMIIRMIIVIFLTQTHKIAA